MSGGQKRKMPRKQVPSLTSLEMVSPGGDIWPCARVGLLKPGETDVPVSIICNCQY